MFVSCCGGGGGVGGCLCQAEDGIRDLVRSRGLGDVYKRQLITHFRESSIVRREPVMARPEIQCLSNNWGQSP